MIFRQEYFRPLNKIEFHLARLGRDVVNLLQRGLKENELNELESQLPFLLTEEIRFLFEWRNGTHTKEGDVLDELNFFPGFYFPSLEEAIAIYGERRDAPQWRPEWFPVFVDGAGDFYVVPCHKKRQEQCGVIGFIHGEPFHSVEYKNLSSMLETLSSAYDQEVFYLDDDDNLEMDYDAYRVVARRFNPGISEWQQ
jgi:cell wall assembly regulator SMI1